MSRLSEPDWTVGPAKWAAVIVLGGASIFGMAWSITMRRPIAGAPPVAVAALPGPAPVEPPSQPGRVILREEPSAEASNTPPARKPTAGAPALTARLNVNTATAAELELLPGIGPALAGRIVDDRRANGPFKSVDDLDRVKGIGPKILERIRELCSVE
jgi:competence protein ComEA